ncbi:MAG TPA: hypothetical protein VFC51_18875 [Chloroflexota bacterium]|nr:hypothetical protein [Chloroflexota bacterium]
MAAPDGMGGTLLTDGSGWTLYAWAGDAPGVSNCFDACADAWPPYVVEGDLVVPGDVPGTVGVIDRGDGSWQVTMEGWPLYYFSGDAQPGDVNGNGIVGFGAGWHVVALSTASAPPASYGIAPYGGAPASMAPPPYLPPPSTQQAAPPQQAPPQASPPSPFYNPYAPNASYSGPSIQQGRPLGTAPIYSAPYIPSGYSQTLTIVAPPNGIVSLTWVATPAAQSYRIYDTLSTQPLNFSVARTVSQSMGQLVTNAILTGLTPGATYFVQVRAVDPNGLETVTPASALTGPMLGR